jgi:hypothetical protein
MVPPRVVGGVDDGERVAVTPIAVEVGIAVGLGVQVNVGVLASVGVGVAVDGGAQTGATGV